MNKASQKTECPLILTATELFDNLAKLIPLPHRHRHHYHGVLAPNSKQRSKVTQFANQYYRPATAESGALQDEHNIEEAAGKLKLQPQVKKGSRNWARLISKVYEVDPLKCEGCGFDLKLIAFIKDAISITKILTHLGEEVEAPKMQRARPPPKEVQVENEIDGYHEPEYEYDQTVSW